MFYQLDRVLSGVELNTAYRQGLRQVDARKPRSQPQPKVPVLPSSQFDVEEANLIEAVPPDDDRWSRKQVASQQLQQQRSTIDSSLQIALHSI
jgi:hypothetical protein